MVYIMVATMYPLEVVFPANWLEVQEIHIQKCTRTYTRLLWPKNDVKSNSTIPYL